MITIGRIYREQGRLSQSMEVLLNAKSMAETNMFHHELARCNLAIGNIYVDLGDPITSLTHTKNALNYLMSHSDEPKYYYSNIISQYYSANYLDSAQMYLDTMVFEFSKPKALTWEKSHLNRMRGRLSEARGNWSEALKHYRQSLVDALESDDIRNAAYGCYHLASIYHTTDQFDSAFFYAHKGLNYANLINQQLRIYELSKILSELYEYQGDYKKANNYQKLMSSTKDKLIGVESVQSIQLLLAGDEKRKRELIDAEKSFENRIRLNILLGSSFTLIVVVFLLYRNNRVQKKSKRKTEVAYERLQNTQTQLIHSEKMASLGELTAGIAHEIQNPLNFVNNFSEINTELVQELKEEAEKGDIGEVKAIASDIEDNEKKISHHGKRAEGIVKSMLQHSRTGSGEKELTDINALADEYLRLAYHGLRAKDQSFNADFKTELDPDLPKVNVVPQDIGRVLLNLINNAFQAVKDVGKPLMTVHTSKINGHIEIKVTDNGPGIPDDIKDKIFQPFFTTKPTGEGTGLGLSMSYDIVTKGHGGELRIAESSSRGTTFIIILKQ